MNKCEPSLLKQKHHKGYLLVRTKICRSAGGIFVLGSWFWFEPRFAQESWGNLCSWFLVLVRTKICSGVLGESLFLVLGFGSSQDLLRSPGGILVLGFGSNQDWLRSLGEILALGFSRECILNAFFPECYHWSWVQSVSIAYFFTLLEYIYIYNHIYIYIYT